MKKRFVVASIAAVALLALGVGVTQASFVPTCDGECPHIKEEPPDQRINPQHGDDVAIFYNGIDGDGKPALDMYCLINGKVYYGLNISITEFQKFPAMPKVNTLVKRTNICGQWVEFYILTTGELQINIHRPAGQIAVIVIPYWLPAARYYYYDIE